MDKSPNKPKPDKKKPVLKDLEARNAGKIKGGRAGWDVKQNPKV